MSNFALGRLVRMALVGGIGYGVVRLLLASTAVGVRVPPQQHPVLAGFAAILLMILASKHT